MSQERDESNVQPPTEPLAQVGLEPATASEQPAAPGDMQALVTRVAKMTNKMMQDMAVFGQTAAAISHAMTDGFGKLQLTFAMLTKQVATNDVKIDNNLLDLRKQFSADLVGLSEKLGAELMNRAIEHILLTAVADVIDNADIVLGMAASTPQSTSDATVTALRMMRDKLLDSFLPLGVKQLEIVPCESQFDENLHVCVAVAHPEDPRTTGLAANIVTDIYKHGYTLHGRVIRRATVVMKGA